MTEDQIKHMVDRFLQWGIPEGFNPDGGISFERYSNKGTTHQYENHPSGTNLFSATEAEAMVRYMLEGLVVPPVMAPITPADAPEPEPQFEIPVNTATYNNVRKALVEAGTGGVILERPLPRRIEMTGVTIVERT